MQKPLIVAALVTFSGFGFLVPGASSAPAPADRPVRYEYAEVTLTRSMTPPAQQPGRPAGPWVERVKAAWTTADEVIEAETWDGLASKLKASAAKSELTEAQHQLRVFNRLGADGWEVYERTTGNRGAGPVTVWSFKRRVP